MSIWSPKPGDIAVDLYDLQHDVIENDTIVILVERYVDLNYEVPEGKSRWRFLGMRGQLGDWPEDIIENLYVPIDEIAQSDMGWV